MKVYRYDWCSVIFVVDFFVDVCFCVSVVVVMVWEDGVFVVILIIGFGDGSIVFFIDFVCEDVVYDVKWLLVKFNVFVFVDGVGWFELWDIVVEMEEFVLRILLSF